MKKIVKELSELEYTLQDIGLDTLVNFKVNCSKKYLFFMQGFKGEYYGER